MQSRIEGRDGWVEVTRDGVAVLAKGDDALAERIGAALDAADGDELADVVTDELSSGGVRRTPDFAVVDHASGRVLVRGTASVQVVAADGSTREFLAPARGPWADEDAALDGEVVLVTGEPEPAPTPADVAEPEPAAESGAAEPTPSEPAEAEALAPQETAVEEPVAAEPPAAQPTGWAVPSVFGGAPAASGAATGRPQLSVVPDPAPGPDSSGQPARDPAPTALTDQQPVEAGEVVETPAPQAQEISEPEAAPAEPAPVAAPTAPSDTPVEDTPAGEAPGAPAPAAARGDDEEELPSFDFLFGNTHSHRSSLLAGLEEEEAQESIDSGPVAAAGGFEAEDNPANATLAPPTEADEAPAPARPQGPTVGALPGGLPPMPGSAPAQQDDHGDAGWSPEQPMAEGPAVPPQEPAAAAPEAPAAAEDPAVDNRPEVVGASTGRGDTPAPQPFAGSGPSRVQAARDDASGHEPGVVRPQFADGHLVGSRVPTSTPAAAPTTEAAPPSSAAEPAADDGGVISAVPWGGGAAAPGMPGGLPPLPTPDHGAAEPVPAGAAPEEVGVDTGEIPSGPMVLAVRCSLGHHNAPHATRCRVCGQDLPSQTPEQTPRPALGLLRLSTGDVVTLDRGVLIGRAPRASAEASGARAPHLVRISSPDNEISRNHVEIVLDGWHVLVRDLGSTNGTTVALPGSSPVRVRPGDQQTIEPGTTITLADQVSMVFEVTG
ncbi:FHA domain-containing protein [Janibacter indicus]